MYQQFASSLVFSGLLLVMGGCNTTESPGSKMMAADTKPAMAPSMAAPSGPDGTVALPADYKS